MPLELLTPFTKVELEEENVEHKRAIGLFWGNFNPVHIAHLTIADQVRQQLHLEKVVFMPEHNTEGHVCRMLELACEGKEGLEVDSSRCQLQTSSIYETVVKLQQAHPEVDFYFIVGGDMIAGLERWEHIDEFLELVHLVGVRRPRYRSGTSYPIVWVDVPLMDVSGSLIREQFHRGIKPNFLLAPKVLAYILKEGLYV
ncbi:nicotinate-nucleotide adenylyltransferase [Lactococcus termiticola]|uniref:Probable nicotinate-nucleotide adenylyltransferase n=1 Tax=Lactococcus termiticola TaxID=2169526 RepID=A0A2R5HJ87_9LACT|nr:nicotinate-nicotinamide nucleotide adenylyltransferase [Lactococcus termiticola]GBG96590.1 nicotinic acid mononucleotide adenylyltransferase [Lactococcus termiticola]